jgi:hypothetical protein
VANFKPRISYDTGPTVITFLVPPEGDPYKEQMKANNQVSVSSSGAMQCHQLFQEEILGPIKLTFVTETLADSFRTFFENWGSLKKSFTYYPHGDVSTDSGTYTLVDDDIEYKRILPGSTPGEFVYEFEFKLRRVK